MTTECRTPKITSGIILLKKNRPVESIIKAIVVCKYPYGFKEIIPMKDAF